MVIRHQIGNFVELQMPGSDEPLWRYTYSGKPKPYFHPVRTPAGFCVTLFEPHDHLWHRGLWFTIKYINGENFWEEEAPYGVQEASAPILIPKANDSLTMVQEIEWVRPNARGTVFQEQRQITHRQSSAGYYCLDWEIMLKAQADLLLDRTPYTTWGGYGGLIVRGNRNWQRTEILFPDGSTSDRPTGIPGNWSDLSGVFDGGDRCTGGVALFDHPGNIRHPSPWYGATGAGHYLNAAFLFHEPLSLQRGETLSLRYRVVIHDGIWEVPRLAETYNEYAQNSETSESAPPTA